MPRYNLEAKGLILKTIIVENIQVMRNEVMHRYVNCDIQKNCPLLLYLMNCKIKKRTLKYRKT